MKNWKKMMTAAAILGALAILAGCTAVSAADLGGAKQLTVNTAAVQSDQAQTRPAGDDRCRYDDDCRYDGECPRDEDDDWCTAHGAWHDDCPADEDDSHGNHHRHQGNSNAGSTARISGREAKAAALSHSGVREAEAYDWDVEWDDGCWEVSFGHNGVEYEYEISAAGEILRSEKDNDG